MNTRILIAPSKYIQGQGELKNLAKYIKHFGSTALFIASTEDRERV